ncbi:MAG: efflux RND transporter periplasmic adaptor subunit [Syntrophales bacterium]
MKGKFGIIVVGLIVLGLMIGALAYWTIREEAGAVVQKEAKHEEGKDEHQGEEKVLKLSEKERKEFGIESRAAGPGKLTVSLDLPGEIVVNPDRLAHIVPRVPGVVRQVMKNLGDVVTAGETLLVLDSRELADAKASYLAALKRVEIARTNLRREEELRKKKISPEVDYLEASKAVAEIEIELKSAEQKLHTFSLSDDAVANLPSQPDMSYTRYELKAPFSGTIIEKHVALGELVKDEKDVYVIADLSTVWVNVQVYQKDLLAVRKGQRVVISAGKTVPDAAGTISFVEPVAGSETRTALAHVVLPNPNGVLRPGLFVTARLAVEETAVPVLIPKTALVTEGGKTEVFVEEDEGFKLQPVTTGRGNETHVEVVSGMKAGQRYVAKGGFTLKAQMSKGAFGDGHGH